MINWGSFRGRREEKWGPLPFRGRLGDHFRVGDPVSGLGSFRGLYRSLAQSGQIKTELIFLSGSSRFPSSRLHYFTNLKTSKEPDHKWKLQGFKGSSSTDQSREETRWKNCPALYSFYRSKSNVIPLFSLKVVNPTIDWTLKHHFTEFVL